MSVRKLLLLLGVVFVLAGLGLSFFWFNRMSVQAPQMMQPTPKGPAVLVAVGALAPGTLLREGDFRWKEIPQSQFRAGQLLRGEATDIEFLGAIVRRDFAAGEALTANDVVKSTDRRFLSAVLRPGRRAVSLQVDAPNSASGLVLPGDFVDVILTQNFGDNIAESANRSVGETVLHDIRVVAVEQAIGEKVKPATPASAGNAEPRLPRTISLEVNERDAQALLVAKELGKITLAVRSLEGSGEERAAKVPLLAPTWASDVSQAVAVLANIERRKRKAGEKPADPSDTEKRAVSCAGLQRSISSPVAHAIRCPPVTRRATEAGES